MEAIRVPQAEVHETRCPSCGAGINTSSINRRKRVQCPKCREVVELGGPLVALQKPAPPVETEVAELRARLAQMEALEARVALLEKAREPSTPVRLPEAETPRPPRKWRWLAPCEFHGAAAIPPEVAEALLHNLATFERHAITIHATAGDSRAQERAVHLREIFEGAHWTVSGPREVTARGSDPGLFLAVGAFPLPEKAAATYFALTASGLSLNSLLDPNLRRDETILIVA